MCGRQSKSYNCVYFPDKDALYFSNSRRDAYKKVHCEFFQMKKQNIFNEDTVNDLLIGIDTVDWYV